MVQKTTHDFKKHKVNPHHNINNKKNNNKENLENNSRHKPSELITDYSLYHEHYSCLRLELQTEQCSSMLQLPEELWGSRIMFTPFFFTSTVCEGGFNHMCW